MLPGEALHKAGDDGARRARRYLESTTRVKSVWLNTEGRHAGRMTFKWPHAPGHYSYDIGGMLHGGDVDGDMFAVECKKYSNNKNNQGAEYREFLAKCYATDLSAPSYFNHYMWMTWHPFSLNDWSSLMTPEYVAKCVLAERVRIFGYEDQEEAVAQIDPEAVSHVARRLWLWVLSEKQERLVITSENRRLIYGHAAGEYLL